VLPTDKDVSVVVKKELQDDGGNPMPEEITLSYTTSQSSETTFADNLGFESGNNGIIFAGDGAINTAIGTLVPFEGEYYAAISTGERIISNEGMAIGSSSSQIQLGPIENPFSSLSFYYDFISSEFNDYVGSRFDDNAMVTIYGPEGSYTEVIATVNRVARNNTAFTDYPKMPDKGDYYAGHTGWRDYHIENINVGLPAYVIFTVSDVSDNIYSTILAIDSLELE
jgi:hypothetical protein